MFPRFLGQAKVAFSKRLSRHGIEHRVRDVLDGATGHVLDLGAGLSPFADAMPAGVITLDYRGKPGVQVVGDAHRLPFADDSFDVVTCTEVLEHLVDPPAAAAEIVRVLKPGGRLLLTTRFCFPLHDRPGDHWRFTPYTLRRLFAPLDPTVLPQHTAYQTLIVMLVRIVMEPTRLNRLVSPPVLAGCGVLWLLEPALGWLLPTDSLTSGYVVRGEKPLAAGIDGRVESRLGQVVGHLKEPTGATTDAGCMDDPRLGDHRHHSDADSTVRVDPLQPSGGNAVGSAGRAYP
jgi:SAM-dependent methyltransferase